MLEQNHQDLSISAKALDTSLAKLAEDDLEFLWLQLSDDERDILRVLSLYPVGTRLSSELLAFLLYLSERNIVIGNKPNQNMVNLASNEQHVTRSPRVDELAYMNFALHRLNELGLIDRDTDYNTTRYRLGSVQNANIRAVGLKSVSEEFPRKTFAQCAKYYLSLTADYGDSDIGTEIGGGKRDELGGVVDPRRVLETEYESLKFLLKWCFGNDAPEDMKLQAAQIVERISTFLLDSGKWEDRIEFCSRSLECVEKSNKSLVVGMRQRLGWSYFMLGEHEKAKANYLVALDMLEGDRTPEDVAGRLPQLLRDYGLACARTRRFRDAKAYLNRSIREARAIEKEAPIAFVVARLFMAWSLVLEAQDLVERKRSVSSTGHRTASSVTVILDRAKRLLDRLHNEATENGYHRQLTLILRLLGEIATLEGRYEQATSYLSEASVHIAKFYKAFVEVELAFSWGSLFEATGDVESAMEKYLFGCYAARNWRMKYELRRLLNNTKRLRSKYKETMIAKIDNVIYNMEIYYESLLHEYEMNAFERNSPHPENPEADSDIEKRMSMLSDEERQQILANLIAQYGLPDSVRHALEQANVLPVADNSATNSQAIPIQQAFEAIIDEQTQRAYRPPTRFKRIFAAFEWGTKSFVTTDELAQEFPKPALALNTIYDLEKLLEPYGLTIERGYKLRHIGK